MLMKKVRCPDQACGEEVKVQAEVREAVQQYRGAPGYQWQPIVCVKCRKQFEYDGDPRSTRTRPKT